MPKNTQMHTQWITVNGQSVPLVLPQYWDGNNWVVSSEQNPLPVKAELTGSNVPVRESVSLLSRDIRSSSVTNQIIKVPTNAKGLVVYSRNYGVTGSFGDGEGLLIRLYSRAMNASFFRLETGRTTTSVQTNQIIILPGVSVGDAEPFGNYVAISGLPLTNEYRFDLLITGTFNDGEGFDCEVRIDWFY